MVFGIPYRISGGDEYIHSRYISRWVVEGKRRKGIKFKSGLKIDGLSTYFSFEKSAHMKPSLKMVD